MKKRIKVVKKSSKDLMSFVQGLAEESLSLVEGYCDDDQDYYFYYLCFYLELLLKTLLNTPCPKNLKTKEDRTRFIYDNFQSIKVEIQNQVAESFNRTMRITKDKEPPVRYFCLISVVPEPINKEPI